MQFVDERNAPAPVPDNAPKVPYRVERQMTGPSTAPREWPVKVYPSGGRELMSEDEAAVWARVLWLETAIELSAVAPPRASERPPPRPYDAQVFTFGSSRAPVERMAKVGRTEGPLLTPDEIAAWEYLRALEEKYEALKAAAPPEPEPALGNTTIPAAEPSVNLNGPEPAAVALEMPTNAGASAPAPAPLKAHVRDAADGPAAECSPGIGDVTTANNTPISNATEGAESAEDAADSDARQRRALTDQIVAEELIRDPSRPNGLIAEIAHCSDEKVRLVRKRLVAEGVITDVPVVRKNGLPYGVRPAESVGDAPGPVPENAGG